MSIFEIVLFAALISAGIGFVWNVKLLFQDNHALGFLHKARGRGKW